MEGWISVLLFVSLGLVHAVPLSGTIGHKNVKRSAEAVIIGNHQNRERVKKSEPPHIPQEDTLVEQDTPSKQDETRDETAKVDVETTQVDTKTDDDGKTQNETTAKDVDDPAEEATTDKDSEEETGATSDSSDGNSSEEKTQSNDDESEETKELEQLSEELPRLTQKERDEIDLLLEQLNLPESSPLYRDYKRSSKRGNRWRISRRRRNTHQNAMESSMSLAKRSPSRSKRETWYPFMVQAKRQDPDYDQYYNGDYADEYADYAALPDEYNAEPEDNYDIPISDEEADDIIRQIVYEAALEEAEKEAEQEGYPLIEQEYDQQVAKRQMLSMMPGIKRSESFYPYQELDQSPWSAAIREETEKRNIQAQYDRLYRLAEALRGPDRR